MIKYYEEGEYAIFDGLVFRKDKRTGYYLNSKTHKRLHVYVWEYHNGKIPSGHHVHHKDFDKANNEITNLELLTARQHMSLHGKTWDKKRYEKQIKILDEEVRPKASEWHGSEAGREWHKVHYEKTKENLYRKKKFVCEQCGKEFEAINHGNNRFCSNNCRSAYRRKSGVDNEERICEWCGQKFEVNKYAKTKTCSRTCRGKLRWDKKRKESEERTSLQYGSGR